jgi:hypothetical protein
MDLADLLQSNIDLTEKNINTIINYTHKQKKNSIYCNKLYFIGYNSIKNYLESNSDFMKIILNEFQQRKILIKIYKQKIKENFNDPIKINILRFGLKIIKNNLYDFQNEHKNIFKKNMYLI